MKKIIEKTVRNGVDFGHTRLPELMTLADNNEPFYLWVEKIFRVVFTNEKSLSDNILFGSHELIEKAITECYLESHSHAPVPTLVNGAGQSYPHRKACYYFFAWLVRDAPQQRLAPLLKRMSDPEAQSRLDKITSEISVLTALFISYRSTLKTFEWASIREVFYDRLEGSRRSLKGHAVEIVVRTALVDAIQHFFEKNGSYGIYDSVVIPAKQIQLGAETFDVSARLVLKDGRERLLLIPVKSRETEGGGHAHIFTRDINSAIDASKQNKDNFVVVFIIAKNWSEREQRHVAEICDLSVVISDNPNSFADLPDDMRQCLRDFISEVLSGRQTPKRWEEIRGLVEKGKS